VAIIDFDVHHGNGTQNIFYDNEQVLYISSHQYPYYPGSGAANEKGNKDNVLNVPLSAGTQSHEFLNAYDSIFKKLKDLSLNLFYCLLDLMLIKMILLLKSI